MFTGSLHVMFCFNCFRTRPNTISEKAVNELSSLLKDEDILENNNKVIKYDPKTDTNVIF